MQRGTARQGLYRSSGYRSNPYQDRIRVLEERSEPEDNAKTKGQAGNRGAKS